MKQSPQNDMNKQKSDTRALNGNLLKKMNAENKNE